MSTGHVALGEFAEGFDHPDHPDHPDRPVVTAIRDGHIVTPIDDQTSLTYARVSRELRRRGALIGTNDLWIGCTSLRLGLPIVTAKVEHFQRISGLGIVAYR